MEEQRIKELVQRMKQGEQAAYEEVYRETYRSVYFICLGFMKNEENAKDAMQDTYMTAFSKLAQLKEEEKFVAWLKQIAVNRCKRLLEQTGPELMEAEDLENLKKEENENFLPEEYITNKAKRKIVMDIMRKKLSDIQYQTVILFYFNGLEIEEIADMMECPPGTVKSRLSVARNKIKEGVLEYEKESKDKLYSFVGIPFLTSLLAAEASGMDVPDIWDGLALSISKLTKGNVDLERKNNFDRTREESKAVEAKSETVKQDSSGVKGDNKMSNKIKAGTKMAKSKVLIGVLSAVVLIGAGIGIAIVISNKGNETIGSAGNNAIVNQENGGMVETGTESGSEGIVENGSDDTLEVQEETVQVHEVFHLQQRWLTSHDFSTGQLDSAPADFVFFEDTECPFGAPYTFDFIDEFPNIKTDLSKMIDAKDEEGVSAESLLCDNYYRGYSILVYNLTSQELSMQECIDNGWVAFYGGNPTKTKHFELMLGYNKEDIVPFREDGIVTDRDYLEEVLKDFGSPTYIGMGMTMDSMDEMVDEMIDDYTINIDTSLVAYYESAMKIDGDETVHFAWEFEEYVLVLTILDGSAEWEEGIYSSEPRMLTSALYDREVWNALLEVGGYNYGENKIDAFFPEGFVMPEKTN